MPAFEPPGYPADLKSLEDQKRGETWARKALEGECAIAARAANGSRNNTLNEAAFKMGRKVGAGYLTAREVAEALMAAAAECGYVQSDGPDAALATIWSGLNAGQQEPQHPEDRTDYRPPSDHMDAVGPMMPRHQTGPQKAPSHRSSRFFSAADLKGRAVPPREWLVHGWIPMKHVTMLMGDGGTGKSLVALQLATAVASGALWLGREVKAGRVIVLSAEDDEDELHRRLADILPSIGKTFDDLSGLTLRSLAGEDALLAIETKIQLMQTELFAELEKRAEDEAPVLIVLDTLADVYPANENDRAKVRQFIGILRGLAIRQKCSVLLLGHPSLTGMASGTGASGSTAWNNSVRSRLYLTRIADERYEANPDARVLTKMKANYDRVGEEISVTWREGVFEAQAAQSGLDRMAANVKAERVFLKLLRQFADQGRTVNHAGGPMYAPKVFAEQKEAEGCNKRVLRAAMDALLASGAIRIEEDGPPSKRRQFLAEGSE